MLGDKYSFKINIGDKEYGLYLSFSTLKNLYNLSGINPFKYLSGFMSEENEEELDIKLGQILLSASNGRISVGEIQEYIISNNEVKYQVLNNLARFILEELKEELIYTEEDYDEELEESEDDDERDDDFAFEKWWNHFYYIGTCVLRMSENKFYKSSPRELKTLEKLSNNYLKNTLLDTYTTIIKAQNSSEGYEENREEKKIYVGRARDLFK